MRVAENDKKAQKILKKKIKTKKRQKENKK